MSSPPIGQPFQIINTQFGVALQLSNDDVSIVGSPPLPIESQSVRIVISSNNV